MSYWHRKAVLVTGGSAGLGRHIAKEFHRLGAEVVLVARDEAKLAQAAQEIGTDRIHTFSADITVQENVAHAISSTVAACGRLDAIVNCAGKSARGSIEETTPEDFQELWELNFLALVRCTRACLPHIIQTQGHVVNIGSLAAKSASRFLGAYPATKFPVAAYSQQLRLELSDRGVHVLLVCPGPIRRDDASSRYASDNVPAEAMRPGGGVKIKGIDPAWLARRISRACQARRLELVVPAKAKLLFMLANLSPKLGDWITRKMTS